MDTLNTLENLAKAYVELRRPSEAVPLLERVRNVKAARYPADHPDLLTTLHNLSGVYAKAGRLSDAIRLMEQVRNVRLEKSGPTHPQTVRTEGNLAVLYLNGGRAAEAVPLLERTLAAQSVKPGPDHPDTVATLCNLAFAYSDAGDRPKSLAAFEQALPKARKAFTATHPRTISLTEKYVILLGWAGQYNRAAELMAELVTLRRGLPDVTDSTLATSLADLGNYLLKANRPKDAEKHLRECLAIRNRKKSNVWAVADVQSLLGASLTDQGMYAEAEPLLLAGYEGLSRATEKPATDRVVQAADRLIRLYLVWDKPAEMAKWQAVRAKYPPEQAPLPQKAK